MRIVSRLCSANSQRQLLRFRRAIGGRVGAYMLDTQSQLELAFNARERFAMCSTFKLLLAAAVLRRVDVGTLTLDHKLPLRPEDMVSHAPVTSAHLAEGSMSVRDLCAATVTVSDNPAANILLAAIGGPSGLTQFLRGIGDRVTRLDRTELELNTNLPGDPRDTTTPAGDGSVDGKSIARRSAHDAIAIAVDRMAAAIDDRLAASARRAAGGLEGGRQDRQRANGAANDLMIAWPPGRSAVIGAVYMSESTLSAGALDQAHAEIGRVFAAAVARQ